MLGFIRKKIQGPILQVGLLLVIFAFIATIFYAWGMGDEGRAIKPVAVVNGFKIPYVEFRRAYDNRVRLYKRFYPQGLDSETIKKLKLKEGVLDGLIKRRLLLEKADEYNILVSEKELQEKIQGYSQFQENGGFSFKRYKSILEFQNMSPGEFEDSVREDVLVSKVEAIIKDNANVSLGQVEGSFKKKHEKVKMNFIVSRPFDLIKDIKPSDEELKGYYEKHKENFKNEEKVKVAYIFYPADKFASSAKVSQEEIELYYDEHIDTYKNKKKVRFRQIVLKAVDGDKQKLEEVKKKAEELRKKAVAGEDFAALAKENSEDSGTAAKGGDMGFFEEYQLMPQLRTAFELKVGEISPILKSALGYHLLKAEEIQESATKPIEEVKSTIVKKLSLEKAKDDAYDRASQDSTDIMLGKSIDELVKGDGRLEYALTDFFERRGNVKGVGRNALFTKAAFDTEIGSMSEVVEVSKGFYILKPTEKKDPEVMSYEDAAAKIKREYITEKSKELAKENAEKFIGDVKGNIKGFKEIAEKYKLKMETKELTRDECSREIGYGTADKIFDMDTGKLSEIFEQPRGFYVVMIDEKIKADMKELEKEKKDLISSLTNKEKERLFSIWISDVKGKAQITTNEDLL